MTPIFLVSLVLIAWVGPARAQYDTPAYEHCRSNLECSSGHCCAISPIRYSVPQCRPMQQLGKVCRPNSATTINMTVGYPDGAEMQLTEVHYILCPCAEGLSCDTKEGVCKNTSEKKDANRLVDEEDKQDD